MRNACVVDFFPRWLTVTVCTCCRLFILSVISIIRKDQFITVFKGYQDCTTYEFTAAVSVWSWRAFVTLAQVVLKGCFRFALFFNRMWLFFLLSCWTLCFKASLLLFLPVSVDQIHRADIIAISDGTHFLLRFLQTSGKQMLQQYVTTEEYISPREDSYLSRAEYSASKGIFGDSFLSILLLTLLLLLSLCIYLTSCC